MADPLKNPEPSPKGSPLGTKSKQQERTIPPPEAQNRCESHPEASLPSSLPASEGSLGSPAEDAAHRSDDQAQEGKASNSEGGVNNNGNFQHLETGSTGGNTPEVQPGANPVANESPSNAAPVPQLSKSLVDNTSTMDDIPLADQKSAGLLSKQATKKLNKQRKRRNQVAGRLCSNSLNAPIHQKNERNDGGSSNFHGGNRNATDVKFSSNDAAVPNNMQMLAPGQVASRKVGGRRICASKQQRKKKSKTGPIAKQSIPTQAAPSTSGQRQKKSPEKRLEQADEAAEHAELNNSEGPAPIQPLTVPSQPTTDTENLSRRESRDPYVFCNNHLNNSHRPMMMMFGRLGPDDVWMQNYQAPRRGAPHHSLLDELDPLNPLPGERTVRPDDSAPALKKAF